MPDHANQDELTALRELVVSLRTALEESRQENALLRQKVEALVRRVFGASSERLDPAQLELLHLPVADPAPVVNPTPSLPEPRAARAKKERAPRLPEHLPVVEEGIDPEPVQAQPEQWRCIGQEVSEQLDDEPGRFLRRRTIRRKYVSRLEPARAPVIAPLPACLQERSLAAPGLLAQIVVSKYCDHLPLYRQEQIFARRHQVHLPRQTMTRWLELAAACLENILPVDFTGTVQCDGSAAYPACARARSNLQLAGCWAHVRRKFHESRAQAPRTAAWLLRQIQHLYQIEARLRGQRAGPQLRAAGRAPQSRPIVQRFQRALVRLKTSRRQLPQSQLGQAIDYTLGQWSTLEVYLGEGRVEIDNNLVENAIRPTALGKKNWLFIGAAEAGQRSASLYPVVECCRRRGLDPYAYLRDVLTRLPRMTNRQTSTVTPETWAKAHPTNLLQKAS